jgi:hypothetical protein
MFSYVAYGLGIHSDLLLPELLVGKWDEDLVIYEGHTGYQPLAEDPLACVRACAEEALLALGSVGSALARGGRELIVERARGVEERVLRLFVLGPSLGVLLHQRGILVLHASVVALRGGAVAFVGWNGSGKSTIAAALYARGHSLIGDDLLAVDVDGAAELAALPGFPQLKLWPDTIVSLGGDAADLPALHPQFEKRARCAAGRFQAAPLPLRRIYVLESGTRLEVEPISGQAALAELLCHSYAARFLGPAGAGAEHLRQCASVAARVPLYRLRRLDSLDRLGDLVRLVERDPA